MALRYIVEDGDNVLTKVSRPVTEFNSRLHQLLDDLGETVLEADGLGLAAPQVGVLRRACVIVDEIDIEGKEDEYELKIIELVNPRIIDQSGENSRYEGCLSFPGLHGYISRFEKVTVEAEDRNGVTFTLEAEGMLARAAQHEIDHLDGKTIRSNSSELLTEDELDELFSSIEESEENDVDDGE